MAGQVANDSKKNNFGVPSSVFDPNINVEKIHAVGTVVYAGISEYQKEQCELWSFCHYSKAWHLYDIRGYLTSDADEDVYMRVAHYHSGSLYTGLPWFATLEKIEDEGLREQIGADYQLVGVDFGYNVFCPKADDEVLFDSWSASFDNIEEGGKCYSF